MKILIILFYSFISCIKAIGVSKNLDILKTAILVFRHGNRSPLFIYENSPCPQHLYLDGLGALNNDGISNAYELGKLLQSRYIDGSKTRLLHREVAYHDIYSRSSDSDRCIQTCLSILASLVPVKGTRHEWMTDFAWVPFPIHSVPPKKDPILRSEAEHCPKLTKMVKDRLMSKETEKLLEDNKEFLDFLSEKSGNTISRYEIWDLYQTLVIEFEDQKAEQPFCGKTSYWATNEVMEKLKNLTINHLNILYNGENREYARLLGGPLLTEIVESLQNAQGSSSSPKLKLYSGHDSTIYHLLSVLKIVKSDYMNFLTTYTFELYEAPTGEKYIKLYFYDIPSAGDGFQKTDIPLCPEPCLLKTFIDEYKSVMSVDREEECTLD